MKQTKAVTGEGKREGGFSSGLVLALPMVSLWRG